MTKLYTLLLLLFLPYLALAQNATAIIDKLKEELKTNPSEKRTAVIYSDLTWYYSNVSIDSALVNGAKAIQASQALGDSTLIAQVFSDVGAVYFRKGDFENSKLNYLKAYNIRKARNDYKGLAKINNNLGNIYEKTQQYKSAMASFLEALEYLETVNDQKTIHIVKGNIGLILLKIKNYDKALSYISEVVNYQQINNSTEELCVSCLNLGNVYLQLKDTTNALKMYEKSIQACTAVGNKKGLASGYNNIATIKTEQRKSKDALALYAKSAAARQELNSELDKANFDLNLAKEYIAKKDYTSALKLLLDVEKVFGNTKNNNNLITNYKSLIDVYAHLNKPDSVNVYVNKLMVLNANLFETSVTKETAELETKYQTLKKEKLLLQKESEAREQRILLIRISALALIIALLGLIFYRQQRTKRKQEAREFALRTEIAEIETQNMLQEQRISISRDLHDNIGSHLTFIISSINNLMFKYKNQNDALFNQLRKIESFAAETIAELRDTIWAMDMVNFQFDDLKNRLIGFIEKQKSVNPDFKIEFELAENSSAPILNSFAGITIYRIIQEFTNNTLKHAKATKLNISIAQDGDSLQIELKDNGVGFDLANCSRGHGLYNMEKRCQELEGEINLYSEPGKGTAVHLTFNTEKLK
jgi:signal transduction histidine kinase